MRRSWILLELGVLAAGCGGSQGVAPQLVAGSGKAPVVASPAPPEAPAPGAQPSSRREPAIVVGSPPRCVPADWSTRALRPLLDPGKATTNRRPDQPGQAELVFAPECTDAPGGAVEQSPDPSVVDGVEIRLASRTPAGSSGRGWLGNQCSFELRLADGTGVAAKLGAREVPPFNTISAVVRAGAAAFVSVSFNGYTAEFPRGGNRVVAVDLCDGRVVWQSKDSTSNGGLLLLGDYLIAPYGFTSERRSVFVLDAHSGSVIQKLPVIENICPSKSFAPHWRPGERCDAPGQAVGAATAPRVEGGVFLVDTNTGSSRFGFAY